MLEEHIRPSFQRFLVDPFARQLSSRFPNFSPHYVTIISGVLGILVAVLLFLGHPVWAVAVLLLSGYLDTLDGTVARMLDRSSQEGAVLDIVMDRLVEFCVILGLFSIDPVHRGLWCILMLGAILLCITSFLVVGIFTENDSNKSFFYSPGLVERAEAFIFFALMMLLPEAFILLSIAFTVLVVWTAWRRTHQFIQQSLSL